MYTVEIIKAIFFGIVEGITEWLPISSTGHLILVDQFLKLNASNTFKELFFVVIQLGAILAVIVFYWKKLWPFSRQAKYLIERDTAALWTKIIVACLPAAVVGLLLDDPIDAMFYNYQTVSLMLVLYGILFILIENKHKESMVKISDVTQIDYKTAFFIGLFQVLALIPGTSRSGATIIGAMLLGTSRVAATEFTFYLAIPVMFGASLLKTVKLGLPTTNLELTVLFVGTLVAFVVSLLAIRFLTFYIKKHNFKVFGWYRIVLGALIILTFLF
ncbi:MAG: undecaprenyl-diphosphate phosphatase [Clostridium sp.]|uniref:undecaprenyl-diphosphate phosphatase n=1 Tax=Clostridium sp. TaxID=1506 RepID=UPI00290F7CDC|nr:undecaprenyl-diphosphate phosphatase [Clostridium sp.]MDU7338495.1 undecaprenyl-diphosphate phosphatase [Clostridium sp.]